MRAKKVQKQIIEALEDIKARDIELIDVTKLTPMFDYVVIASADSGRQARALAMHVHDVAKQSGAQVRMEGENTDWVLVDCGDTVVHIMLPESRAHYNLEELWQPKRLPKRGAKVESARSAGAADAPATTKASATRKRSTKAAPGTPPRPAAKRPPRAKVGLPTGRPKTGRPKAGRPKTARPKTGPSAGRPKARTTRPATKKAS